MDMENYNKKYQYQGARITSSTTISIGFGSNGWTYPLYQQYGQQQVMEQVGEVKVGEVKIPKRRGREMQTLYDVYLVYGGDRIKPVVERRQIIACSEEEAKIKSKIQSLVKDDWDIDFVTIIVNPIGPAAVKERPSEVKSV